MELNEVINYRRKSLNMSVDDLVTKSGVPKGTLSKITAGINANPTLSTVKAICKALDCTLDDLVYDIEHPDDKKNILTVNSEDKQKRTLINNYDNLNNEGQKKLTDYSNDLVSSGNYIKSNPQTDKMNA